MAAKVITLLIIVAGGAISLLYWASKIQGMFASQKLTIFISSKVIIHKTVAFWETSW